MAESASEIAGSLVPVAKQQAMVLLEAGYIWLEMGKYDKAKDVFSGAAVLMPKSEVPQLALGALEFAQGRHDKALQAYRAAQRLAPNSALPRAHAGEALLFLHKVPEAMKELKAALELEPDSDGARFAQALVDSKEVGALPPPKK
jgi:tetratricopeptide (TPR) repeat protein